MKRYVRSSSNDKLNNYMKFTAKNGNNYSVHYKKYEDYPDAVQFLESLNLQMSPIHPYDDAEYPWVAVTWGEIHVYQANGRYGLDHKVSELFHEYEIPDSIILYDQLDDNWVVLPEFEDTYHKDQFTAVLNYCADLIEKYSKDVKPKIDTW